MAYKKLKYWFDKELATLLADKIYSVYPSFNRNRFVKSVDLNVQKLEMKDRVEAIADELQANLPGSYPRSVELLLQIIGPENPVETGMFTNYYWIMPIAKYVEKFGLDDFEISTNAIAEITKRNTGEYAIRPYIELYPEKTLEAMLGWSCDKNFHVRRLSSEGVRPRLPWAKKLDLFIKNPVPILPILENLKDDSSKYVQKSVANCLNDILKDNPEIGREIIEKWQKQPTKERCWIIKHALRNLIKQHDDRALRFANNLKPH